MRDETWAYIQKKAKAWRDWRIKNQCEVCLTNPRKIRGLFGVIDWFVHGRRCDFCFDLIENNCRKTCYTDKEIIEKVGIIK